MGCGGHAVAMCLGSFGGLGVVIVRVKRGVGFGGACGVPAVVLVRGKRQGVQLVVFWLVRVRWRGKIPLRIGCGGGCGGSWYVFEGAATVGREGFGRGRGGFVRYGRSHCIFFLLLVF